MIEAPSLPQILSKASLEGGGVGTEGPRVFSDLLKDGCFWIDILDPSDFDMQILSKVNNMQKQNLILCAALQLASRSLLTLTLACRLEKIYFDRIFFVSIALSYSPTDYRGYLNRGSAGEVRSLPQLLLCLLPDI